MDRVALVSDEWVRGFEHQLGQSFVQDETWFIVSFVIGVSSRVVLDCYYSLNPRSPIEYDDGSIANAVIHLLIL